MIIDYQLLIIDFGLSISLSIIDCGVKTASA